MPIVARSRYSGWQPIGALLGLLTGLTFGEQVFLGRAIQAQSVAQSTLAQSSSAEIAEWTYSPAQGRLEVTTRGGVRPSLFTLQNPSRVVLDFPNTRLGRGSETVPYTEGRVTRLRTSQLDASTTRFVLEVDPRQPLQLDQLQLQTASPERWAVQFLTGSQSTPTVSSGLLPSPPPPEKALGLPTTPATSGSLPPPPPSLPAAINSPSDPLLSLPIPADIPPPNPSDPAPPAFPGGRTARSTRSGSASNSRLVQVQGVTTTPAGFFVKTSGSVSATIRRVSNPERVVVDLLGSRLSSSFTQRSFVVNQLGVYRLRVGQFEPTITRVVLEVDPTAGDWETTYDPQKGGVNILPAGGESQASLLPSTPSNYQGSLATIQSVQLQDNFLTIVADGFLFYRSGWDPVSGGYRISVTPAQLPSTLPNPGLPLNGPVDRIRFVQETPQTVSILVQPARQFNVIEDAPGQGTRRIQLQLQPLDGSPVATAPTLVPPANPPVNPPANPPNQTPLPPTIPEPLPVPVPNKNRGEIRIAIDPGHGGRDPGAIGVGGIQEKKITFTVSSMVADLLRQAGFTVIMLRTDDSEVLLKTRVDEAVRQQADILVSIHANALNRSSVYGMETYYLRPDSARLAQVLHKYMVQGTGATDRGIRRARFYVVRETPTTMPSVLLEMGYVTNPTEGPLLTTPEYQAKLARSIAQGIQAYFSPQ